MGKVYEALTDRLRAFIEEQPVFFVGTAPREGGHVNVSPKGLCDTLVVLDGTTVAYLDLGGSGVETISHIRDNGRVTLMFCAFSGPPKILRLYGTGHIVMPGDEGWDELLARFGPHPGVRSIIVVSCARIADSCGFAVPLMSFEQERDVLDRSAGRKSAQQLRDYRAKHNRWSIDGLPALTAEEAESVPG